MVTPGIRCKASARFCSGKSAISVATIESEKHAAIAEIKNQVAELSLEIAEKVMRSELSDKNKQIKLVEDMLKEVKL